MIKITLIILLSSFMLSIFSSGHASFTVLAQTSNNTMNMSGMESMQGMSDMDNMSDMGGMSGSSSGGHSMMGGMGDMGGMQSAPGSINEMCGKMEGMPPHYCSEPSYTVMSSFMGIKVDKVTPISNNSVQVQLKHFGNESSIINKDIVVVGGGGDLAGSTIIPSGWKNVTTALLSFEGTGSIYSTPSISIHVYQVTNTQ
jgi:hypothetical protein